MQIWSAEIKELEALYTSIKGGFPELEKELEQLIETKDANVVMLYSRRCLEVIITDLCESELKRPRKTEPLKGIIDKLNREEKVPANIIASMQSLNSLSTFGAHPKEFDPEQVRPVLINLTTIIKWYLKHKEAGSISLTKPEEIKFESKELAGIKEGTLKPKKRLALLLSGLLFICILIIAALIVFNIIGSKKQTKEAEKSIAVLPFKLLVDEPDKQYLADGMMDAILLHLQKFRDLRVLSRTSVEQYRGTSKTTRQIGQELDVEYLLEGSFQKYEDNVRLIVQLIKVSEDSHAWANEYNKKWQDIFSVQSEVAQSIADEIKVAVSPLEKTIIETTPTSDLQAYDYYLRGNDYHKRSYWEEDFRYAIQMYEKAVEIDPDFALAWAELSACYRDLFWYYRDRSEEILLKAKKYLDQALVLAPELKEVQFEEARYYYHCELDYSKSLEILEKLKNEYPNNDEIYAWIGYVYRRMGEFGKALEKQGKAISLNPSDWSYWSNRANTLQVLREYSNVENCYKQAIELNPSNSGLYVDLLGFYVNSGQMQKAREFLNVNEKFIDSQNQKRYTAQLEFLARNYVNAIQIVQSLSEDPFSFQTEYYTKYLQLGLIYRKIPDNAMAVMNFKIERDLLLKKINETRNDQRLYRSLGIVYAGLGMKKEAIEAGRKALEMLDFSKDALGGFEPEMDMVRILIMVGEYDEAIIRLDNIMERHGDITAEILKLDPFWDPVRDHEKFKEIVSNPAYQVSLSGE